MKTYKNPVELAEELEKEKREGKIIGFVPTMGALHEGHMNLVRKSLEKDDITVASIFVNPVQFNNKEDLKKYPRILDKDRQLLEKEGVHYLFAPTENEMYPEGLENIKEKYDFGHLDKILEGKFRPGHFNGVAIVVKRLFEIVKPHHAYFGKKDYQQLLIIKELVRQFNIPVEIIPTEIVREPNGLAMSSRNLLLTDEEKELASNIYKALVYGKNLNATVKETKTKVLDFLHKKGLKDVEYFAIANKENLMEASNNEPAKGKIALIAVNCCGVRLIDNMEY